MLEAVLEEEEGNNTLEKPLKIKIKQSSDEIPTGLDYGE